MKNENEKATSQPTAAAASGSGENTDQVCMTFDRAMHDAKERYDDLIQENVALSAENTRLEQQVRMWRERWRAEMSPCWCGRIVRFLFG